MVKECIIENEYAFKFMTAGKSEFTLLSKKTGVSFTYRLAEVKNNKNKWFLSMVRGIKRVYGGSVEVEEDGFYFKRGLKGSLNNNDKEVLAILYVLNNLYRKVYNIPVEVYQYGRCGRCGNRLKTPESLIRGLGPVCAKRVEEEFNSQSDV